MYTYHLRIVRVVTGTIQFKNRIFNTKKNISIIHNMFTNRFSKSYHYYHIHIN